MTSELLSLLYSFLHLVNRGRRESSDNQAIASRTLGLQATITAADVKSGEREVDLSLRKLRRWEKHVRPAVCFILR